MSTRLTILAMAVMVTGCAMMPDFSTRPGGSASVEARQRYTEQCIMNPAISPADRARIMAESQQSISPAASWLPGFGAALPAMMEADMADRCAQLASSKAG